MQFTEQHLTSTISWRSSS